MCVGFWTLDHPEWSLVLCANRDEFLDRPTRPAQWHNFPSKDELSENIARKDATPEPHSSPPTGSVLSGIDVQAGGTWFGINHSGRVAFITNITEPHFKPHKVSRGALVAAYLDPTKQTPQPKSQDLSGFLDAAVTGPEDPIVDTAGFNLLLLEPQRSSTNALDASTRRPTEFSAALLSNSGGETPIRARTIRSASKSSVAPDATSLACEGLSNGIDRSEIDGLGLRDPWKKIPLGEQLLAEVLAQYEQGLSNARQAQSIAELEGQLVEDLMNLLGSRAPQPIITVRDMRDNIFVPASLSIRSSAKWYGTRLSTVILIRRTTGEVLFVERDRSMLVPRDDAVVAAWRAAGGRTFDEAMLEQQATIPWIMDPVESRRTQRVYRFTIP
ncbi:hypothetical protein DL93DRAFT_2164312 [Clavulina sp. PMI_390]|nr:hypothetical protein DL93DRAFT_2164312 [Clavulina sp. PMI_390]